MTSTDQGSGPLRLWTAFGVFVLLTVIFLFVAHPFRDPAPTFQALASGNPEEYFPCEIDTPLEVRFTAPGPLDGVFFRVFLPNQRVEMSARSLSEGDELGESRAGMGWKEPDRGEGFAGPLRGVNFGLDASVAFSRTVKEGEEIVVSFNCVKFWGEVNKGGLKIIREDWEPSIPIEVRAGEVSLEGNPQMVLIHAREGWSLLWAWALVPVFLGVAIWKPTVAPWWLVFLGVCALLTSWFSWQQRYSGHVGHLDPDRYGAYAEQMVRWIQEPSAREEVREWIHGYQHAHVALAPALLAIIMLVGPDLGDAWVFLSALVSFGTMLLLFRMLYRQLGLSVATSLFGVLAFATHLIFLRSFGRPTTDQIGLLLVMMMLSLLVDRMKQRTAMQTLGIALLVAPLILVRPPGMAYGAFLVGMTPFCDWLREKKFRPLDHLLTVVKVGIGPVVLVGLLYLAFGWGHNFQLAMAKREQFLDQWTQEWFRIMMVIGIQGLLVWWVFPRFRRDWRELTVLGLWLVLHTVLLVVSQAPFITRMMLPVLPCIIALTCMGIGRFRNPVVRGIGYFWLTAHAAANLAVTIWVMSLPAPPKNPLDHWFHA